MNIQQEIIMIQLSS